MTRCTCSHRFGHFSHCAATKSQQPDNQTTSNEDGKGRMQLRTFGTMMSWIGEIQSMFARGHVQLAVNKATLAGGSSKDVRHACCVFLDKDDGSLHVLEYVKNRKRA